MVTKKRKKNTRQRAGTTHGWGSMKKHRGAGNRGGVGMAGSGKRGDSKKPSVWKNKRYFGMYGFKKKGAKIDFKCINVADLDKYAKGKNELNLNELGFNKLLGSGKVTKSYIIKVDYASARAVAKIEQPKGKVNILKSKNKGSQDMVESNKLDVASDSEAVQDSENPTLNK